MVRSIVARRARSFLTSPIPLISLTPGRRGG